ncbi:hypothetical protein CON64_07280 [Bacillus pseudomycoides]|nr:hypothetical protein CON64_07280 [Bacillus pseudomycoides]
MSLRNDTFKIELSFRERNNKIKTKIVSYKGSLKSAIRRILEEYGSVHMAANFYNSKGTWLKEIEF